jgi:hypothetical protein
MLSCCCLELYKEQKSINYKLEGIHLIQELISNGIKNMDLEDILMEYNIF